MAETTQILVVDDDRSTRDLLHSILSSAGYGCRTADGLEEAGAILEQMSPHIALLDIYVGQSNGIDFVQQLKTRRPECKCVMMTAHATVETVARSLNEGAVEYLQKPLLIDELLRLVRRLEQPTHGPSENIAAQEFLPDSAIIGNSPRMLEVYRSIARAAPTDASVLITGASGTGKELVARAIHSHSARSRMPFTAVNCGAFPESILESELFGYDKGAFTGADRARGGLFEASNGGTLFLDEISETGLAFQTNLLRVVQQQEVRRLGSSTAIPVNVRILAATNADLNALMKSGRFRTDLFYRLGVVTIVLPSLEARREDIPLLVNHFLQRANARSRRSVSITKKGIELLQSMSWPGNIRELENLVERLVIFSSTGEIVSDDIEQHRNMNSGPTDGAAAPETLRQVEREQILRVLRESGGNKSLAARRLGIERKTLYQKAQRLGIDLKR